MKTLFCIALRIMFRHSMGGEKTEIGCFWFVKLKAYTKLCKEYLKLCIMP